MKLRRLLIVIPALLSILLPLSIHGAAGQEALPQDRTAAVIFVYQRIGEDQFPDMNIRTEQFASHIKEIKDGGYNVMALPEIVKTLKTGQTLPSHTVAITFDGGHKSVLLNAAPLLIANNMPFTIFVASDYADRASPDYISWDDVKKLARNKLVTIGLHPASYMRLTDLDEDEIKRQVNNARTRTREMTGIDSTLFAYPLGEYSNAYKDILISSGFDAAFGQQSGVAYAGDDLYALPRFTMTETYGDLDRFKMTASALPLPVSDTVPKDPHLDTRTPVIGFTVDKALKVTLKNISCFASDQEEKPKIELVGGGRVELRIKNGFDDSRARLNCTMPGPTGEADAAPRWRWFGMLMTVPAASDSELERELENNSQDTKKSGKKNALKKTENKSSRLD